MNRVSSKNNEEKIKEIAEVDSVNAESDARRNELEEIVKSNITTGKRKLLIIEDDELNREMLCSILAENYEIFTAENGEIGFEMLEENYQELSAILLDIQMPVCDGIEFLKKMRESWSF